MALLHNIRIYLKEKPLRLTQVIILLTGLVLFFSYLFFFKSSMDSVKETAIFLRLGIAETSKTEIENFIDENTSALSELTKKISVTEDEMEKKDLIERVMREKSWLSEIMIADQEGNEAVRMSKYSISGLADQVNISETEEFKMAIMGQPYLCRVHMDEKSIPILTIALPIEGSEGMPSGVLVAQLSLQKIWNIISSSNLITADQKVYVVDSEGFLISHPDTSSVLKKTNLLDKTYVKEVITEKKTVRGQQFSDKDNHAVTLVGVPVKEDLGWGIFVEEPSQTAMASYNKIRSAAIIFIFLTFALLFVLIVNSQTLSNVFSDFKKEVKKRTSELEELDKTTRLLIKRDLELSEANKRLEELDAVKSDFVSIAAHQLRTPLTGIKWSFIALQEKETGPLNPEQKKIVDSGLDAIDHTINLINDLLNVAHIEEGKFGFNFKETAILPVIQKSFERFEAVAGEKGVWFTTKLTEKPLPNISVDSEKISLALDNLLDNAIKYTSPGGKVTLEVAYEKNEIKITVSDTGIGIPKNQFDRVFSKFFRAENALLFQTSGSGLGLYMVKNIIDRHCGTITVKSEENRGTTFVIALPDVCKV
jgi:signal transduction histidine kinase